MKSFFSSFLTKLTLTASVASVLVGCDEPEYGTPTPVTESTVGQARVLVVNASPGSQSSIVTIDNTTTGQSIDYLNSVSSGYLSVPAGLRQIGVVSPNNVKDGNGTALPGIVRQQFASGSSYTVFSTDAPTRALAGSDPGGIRAIALSDNLAAPAANRARIRFVNLSPSYGGGADSLGLFTTSSPSATGTTAPNRYLFAPIGRSYRSIAFTVPAVAATATTPARPARSLNFANFTDVPAGTYTFQVRRSATAASNPSQVIIQNTPLTFASGKIYTIYSRGTNASMSATPLGLTVVLHN